jgi:TrkA domain protein
MVDVIETPMPGVGVRYGLTARSGRAVGVVAHHTGRRDLIVYDTDDPDAALVAVELTEDEGKALGELLGGSRIVEQIQDLAHEVEGLMIDWVRVAAGAALAGETLASADVRATTGASVVALVRGEVAIPAPGGDDQLLPGDTAVVVGTPDAVKTLAGMLQANR